MRHPDKNISSGIGSVRACTSKRRGAANILALYSSKLLPTEALKRPHQRTILWDAQFGQSELGSLLRLPSRAIYSIKISGQAWDVGANDSTRSTQHCTRLALH